MATIVSWHDRERGVTELDPPDGPVVIGSVDSQVDGEGDTNVHITYTRAVMATIVTNGGDW